MVLEVSGQLGQAVFGQGVNLVLRRRPIVSLVPRIMSTLR